MDRLRHALLELGRGMPLAGRQVRLTSVPVSASPPSATRWPVAGSPVAVAP